MLRSFLNRNSISAMKTTVKSTKKPTQATTRVSSSASHGNNLSAVVQQASSPPLDSFDTSLKKLPAVDTEKYITYSLTATDDSVLQHCISMLLERFRQLAKSEDPVKLSAQLLLVTMNFKNEYAAAKKMRFIFDEKRLPEVLNSMIPHLNFELHEKMIQDAIYRSMKTSSEEHFSWVRRP